MNLKNISTFKNFKKLHESLTGGDIRVRFAPSPTGPLHIGGVRTALYNYLFARKHNGKNILRIEDTDQTRFVPGSEDYIIKSLDWLGIEFDEGPHVGGSYGPYRQSERKSIYREFYKQLIDNGKAYYAFDTEEEMNAIRAKNQHFAYDSSTRGEMKNSLTLSSEEVDRLLNERDDWVVRIKFEPNQTIVVDDIIRGRVQVNSSTLDDKVLFKAKDDLPTYHLANIVDDHLMKISHVIRGEEWLPSAPLHIYLYQSFGWDPPQFAHLPLILKPFGDGKLSKRDGDKYGFPVFPLEWNDPKKDSTSMGYREEGYLPDAVINILAFLGWNPGTEKEMYTMDDLIRDFSLSRVQKAGARFNVDKAKWFNGQHMKNADIDELTNQFIPYLEEKGIELPYEKVKQLVEMGRGRANFVKDIYDAVKYFFEKPESYDRKIMRKKWTPETPGILLELKDKFEEVTNWNTENIKKAFEDFVNEKGYEFGDVMPALRLVMTGMGFGPDIFGIIETIGKEESLNRLSDAPNIKK
jgi:glutamyl-tRNA synthetase